MSYSPEFLDQLRSQLRIDHDNPIEKTSLLRGKCVASGNAFIAKFIPKQHLASFMANEGQIYALLNDCRHLNLPTVAFCLDKYTVPSHTTTIPNTHAQGSVLFFPDHGDTLQSVLTSEKTFSEAQARLCFRQLLNAVAHCHSSEIVLRDLRLSKALFTTEEHDLLTLLDLSGAVSTHTLRPENFHFTSAMISEFTAPEVFITQGQLPSHLPLAAVDMYALGIALYKMLVGAHPFIPTDSPDLPRMLQRVYARNLIIPSRISPAACALLRRLLEPDAALRPSAAEVCADAWVQGHATESMDEVQQSEESETGEATESGCELASPPAPACDQTVLESGCGGSGGGGSATGATGYLTRGSNYHGTDSSLKRLRLQ